MTLYHTKIVTRRDSSNVLMACYVEAPTPGQARTKLLEEFQKAPDAALPAHMRLHILKCQEEAKRQGGALPIATKSASRTPGQASFTVG